MKFSRAILVPAPVEHTWDSLWDVDRLAACVPGCSDVQVLEFQKSYTARITQRVGPMSVSFPLRLSVLEAEAPRLLRVSATGADQRVASRLSASVDLRLAQRSAAETEVEITSEVDVHGRLATLGQSVIARKAEATFDAFALCLVAMFATSKPVTP